MENLKVRVNSVEESKEVQELFFELGYAKGVCPSGNYPAVIIAVEKTLYREYPVSTRAITINHPAHKEYREITIPQLRDMVILKRNDPKDANVIDPEWSHVKLYLSSDNNLYCYGCESKRWQDSNMNSIPTVMSRLKPIAKEKTFKEYLQKLDDGSYKLVKLDNVVDGHDGLIEVPEGAESYSTDSMLGNKIIKFFKPGFIFLDGMWMRCNFQHTDADILWQRHTQPEELPFIDDEPKPDNVNHPSHYTNGKVECIDALESATVGKSGIEAVCTANIIKYLWRYEDKNGLEDVEKAQWYLNKLLDVLKNK